MFLQICVRRPDEGAVFRLGLHEGWPACWSAVASTPQSVDRSAAPGPIPAFFHHRPSPEILTFLDSPGNKSPSLQIAAYIHQPSSFLLPTSNIQPCVHPSTIRLPMAPPTVTAPMAMAMMDSQACSLRTTLTPLTRAHTSRSATFCQMLAASRLSVRQPKFCPAQSGTS